MPITCRVGAVRYQRNEKTRRIGEKRSGKETVKIQLADGADKMNGHSLPLLRGVLPLDTSKLAGDILAGVTLAALGIPEVMGYTKISGNTDRNGALHLTASGYSLCPARGLSPSGCRCGLSNGCNSRVDPRRHRSAWVSGIRRCNESCCAGSCGTVGISEGIQARIPCGFLVPQRLDRL